MSAYDAKVNQYPISVAAGQTLYNVTPSFLNSPSRRVTFIICNTGSTPILYRWETKVQNDGGDMPLAPGEKDVYRDPCPQGRISVQAPGAAAQIAIIECITSRRPPTPGVVS